MQLSHKGSLISGLLQKFRECLLTEIKDTRTVVIEMIRTAVLSGKETCTGRPAEGICDECICETHAVSRNPVQIRCMHMPVIKTAHHLGRMVVSHDENDVAPPVGITA
jgi:hypothetical protein